MFDETDVASDVIKDDEVVASLFYLEVSAVAYTVDIHALTVVDKRAALIEVPAVGLLHLHFVASGKLVGINTAIASGNGFYTGYSFAIPSNIVKKIYNDLKEYGKVQQAYLGVSIAELNATLAKEYGLDDVKGVYIADVEEDGAAAKNDFQEGDVITHIDKMPVNSLAEVRGVLKTKSPGDKVQVVLIRKKEKITKNVTLFNIEGTTELLKN